MRAAEEEFFKEISALNQENFAKYVLSRRTILDLYTKIVTQGDDGAFDKESSVHNLIFPRYKTSDQVPYDEHNLWLIDERLAYHRVIQKNQH